MTNSIYHLTCAVLTHGCRSAFAIDAPPGIDLDHLDWSVPEDRRVSDLLQASGWAKDHGRWVCGNHQTASVVRTLRSHGDILTRVLDAERVPADLASRIFNRFFFGDPDGLDGGPRPHPDLEEQWMPPSDGGRPLLYDPDRTMGERP